MVMFAYVPPDALIAKAPALTNTNDTFLTSIRFMVVILSLAVSHPPTDL